MRAGVMSLFVWGIVLGCGDDGDPIADEGTATMTPATDPTPASTTAMTPASTGSSSSSSASPSSSGAPTCSCDASRCDAEGRCRRYVFVTRDPLAMGEDGLADANAACAAAASSSTVLPQDNAYVAFLATDDAPPWGTIGLESVDDAVFVLPTDDVVGTPEQLRGAQDGTDELEHAIDHDHDGLPLHDDFEMEACAPDPHGVWTGVEASLFAGDCADWSVTEDGLTGVVGDANAVDQAWTSFCSSGCSMVEAHVYCFEVL